MKKISFIFLFFSTFFTKPIGSESTLGFFLNPEIPFSNTQRVLMNGGSFTSSIFPYAYLPTGRRLRNESSKIYQRLYTDLLKCNQGYLTCRALLGGLNLNKIISPFPEEAEHIIKTVIKEGGMDVESEGKYLTMDAKGVKTLHRISGLYINNHNNPIVQKRSVGWGLLAAEVNQRLRMYDINGSLFIKNLTSTKPFWKGKSHYVHITQCNSADPDSSLIDKLTSTYKIHLMPQSGQEDRILWKLLMAAQKNPEQFTPFISEVKILKNLQDKYDINGNRLAKIVIYPDCNKKSAEKLLKNLIELFKDDQGCNKSPRFNIQVNSLIYYAQGDADFKHDPRYQIYYDPETNYALYLPQFGGGSHRLLPQNK